MSGLHGGRGVRGVLVRSLAMASACGLIIGMGSIPARACPIDQHATKASPGSPAPAASTGMTPDADLEKALQTFLDQWRHDHPGQPVVTPPSPSGLTTPAAQTLTPGTPDATPTVAHPTASTGAQPCGCPPPPPVCTGTTPTAPPDSGSGSSKPGPSPSAGGQTVTPAPEPSTLVSALALVGAGVAYRRRRPRAA